MKIILLEKKRALYSALFGGISQLSKIVAGFIFIKLVAVYLGVDGMGQLGNFMSLVTLLSLLAGGGIVNGIIKYVAEYKSTPWLMLRFIRAAKMYSLCICLITALIGVGLSNEIALLIFKDSQMQWIIIILSIGQFGFAFANLVTGTVNGLGDNRTYAIIQMLGNVIFVPSAWAGIKFAGLAGAAVSMIGMFAIYTIPAAYFYRKSRLRTSLGSFSIDLKMFRKLSAFTVMAMVGAISVPIVEIIIRQALIQNNGFETAGLWQASIKISSAYMGFFVMFLAIYLMPILSAQSDRNLIAKIVKSYMFLLGCLFSAGALVFYIFRYQLIPLLLSSGFTPLADIVGLQLIADCIRVITYVISFVVVAKAALKVYVISEVSQGLIFCFTSILLIDQGFGIRGVLWANIIMNSIYLVVSSAGFYYYIKKTRHNNADC